MRMDSVETGKAISLTASAMFSSTAASRKTFHSKLFLFLSLLHPKTA